MSLTHPNTPVSQQDLQDFYHKIAPYMGGGDQVEEMDTPSASNLGEIVQYVGETNANYTNGYFYQCVSDGQPTPTYSWQNKPVQAGGGGGSYTAGAGIDITNNEISTKQSQEGDIDEIIDVYPTAGELVSIVNAFNKGDIYSTDEKMIGQWIDGKPLYQKSVEYILTQNIDNSDFTIPVTLTDLETVANVHGTLYSGATICLPLASSATAVSQGNPLGLISIGVISDSSVQIRCPRQTLQIGDKVYVTIQYTKTTDTAISIGEETEYSTDEKVVGTWIDGKPVYQRTIVVNGLQKDTAVQFGFTADNLVKTNVTYEDENYQYSMESFYVSSSDYRMMFVNRDKSDNSVYYFMRASNSSSQLANLKATFTIQYTKTTS